MIGGIMKNIILIEPAAPGFHIYSRYLLPRLGLPIFGAMLKKYGYDVTIFHQDTTPLDWETILTADLVGISSITSTITEAYKIISRIKTFNPSIPTVIGGPHVTFLADEALTQGADFVVRGEGDITFQELLNWLEDGQKDIREIDGISYKIGNKIFHNKDRAPFNDLDSLPFPDFTLIRRYDKIANIALQTSRGCPFECKFCSVIKMFGRHCRFHSIDYTIEEIRYLKNILGKKMIFFYDDNFCINPAHTKELLERILKEKLDITWSAQVRIETGHDKELLQLMKRTGCKWLYIGFESVNKDTMALYNKNQNIERYGEAIRNIHKHDIRIHGMFVLGADTDEISIAKQTAEFSLKHKLDTVQFMILTPLPGTDTFYDLKKENRIISYDWSLYDAHHVVFQPKQMSPFQLQVTSMLEAMPKFYSRVQFYKRGLISIISLSIFLPSWKVKFQNFVLTAYARRLIKKWKKANSEWLTVLKIRDKTGTFKFTKSNRRVT
jgi:radical SAM superfamily enzyme YgiQ (UPF0313 family)